MSHHVHAACMPADTATVSRALASVNSPNNDSREACTNSLEVQTPGTCSRPKILRKCKSWGLNVGV